LLIAGISVSGILVIDQQEAFSELFPGMELYTETFALPKTFLTTDEIFMLFDTTNIANMSKVTVTANLPCSPSDDPRFKIAVGTLGNFTNIIESSAQSLNYAGPLGSCTYSSTVKASDENITIQRVWLTPNNGTSFAHTYWGNMVTLTALLDNGNMESAPTSSFITATGGTITTDGDYKIHTFTSSDTFEITSGTGNVDYLVNGGGGGGGLVNGGGGGGGLVNGGGGGAGGYLEGAKIDMTTSSFTITIGAGGTGSTVYTSAGGNGGDSVFYDVTAIGGGGSGGAGAIPTSGGSGGGNDVGVGSGAAGTSGQGNKGGDTVTYTNPWSSGGSGGAGAEGGDQVGAVAGNGGDGLFSSITGSDIVRAGGGGGGTNPGGISGSGGGDGKSSNAGTGDAGTANTGGGGGGAAGAGGSGVVILRYQFQ